MGVKFTYFGGMCVLAERSDGYRILCDPYLSGNPFCTTGPEAMSGVDLLVVTHNAYDHFGDAIEIMKNSRARLFAGGEVVRRVQEALPELEPERMRLTIYGDEQNYNGSVIRVMPAWHVSNCVANGAVIANPPFGFVIDIEPGVTYYHAGDTSLFSDMKIIRELYRPDVMAVGISAIEKIYPCEMNPREAAYATQWIGPNVVIPTHYEPGAPELEDYIRYAQVTAPKTVVQAQIEKTWEYVPFQVLG